jgi:exosortase/archaeosortase family protein
MNNPTLEKLMVLYKKIPAPVINVAMFAAILLIFHFIYRASVSFLVGWEPFIVINQQLMEWVFYSSLWFNQHILGLEIRVADPLTMWFTNNGFVSITDGCSGLKQFYQVIVLFLLYPGPWKHKVWYIPMAVVVMHLVNLFRVIILSVIVLWKPEYWHFSHDNIVRPFFYVIVFIMWVIWVEKFYMPMKEGKKLKK